jgi:CRP-like cAMP-binding protein
MHQRSNRLIESLSPETRRQLLASARTVDLHQGAVLHLAGETVAHAYFLTMGVASVVVSVADGGSAEIGLVGNEGMFGALNVLGPVFPLSRGIMQISGEAIRIPMVDVRRMFAHSEEFRRRLLECVQQQELMVNQIAACNKLHQAAERMARWLLTAADRIERDTVSLTQESLSQMLGTRRTTIALVAGQLQKSGMIRYRRGMVHIVDRHALTAAACDCYTITRRLTEGLYL